MNEHPINNMMETTLEKIKSMVDVDTIIGEAVVTKSGVTIIPVSKISYGFVAGGSDLPVKIEKPFFGGGSGAGISISPIAFLIVTGDDVKVLSVDNSLSAADKAVSLVPEMFDKICALLKKDKKDTKEAE